MLHDPFCIILYLCCLLHCRAIEVRGCHRNAIASGEGVLSAIL